MTPRIVTLGSIAERLQDGPFGSNLKSAHYVSSGVRVVRLQNIGPGFFDDRDEVYISSSHFQLLSKHECRPGDLMLATLGDPILRAAILPDSVGRALNKADCIQLRCDSDLASADYVKHYLNSTMALTYANGMGHGQTRQRVNLSQLRELPVPLPPIEEQRRVAAVLDAADALRMKRRQALAKLDTLTQSIFIDMFGDGALAETPIDAVADVQGGLQVTSKRVTNPIEVPYLRVANVHRGRLDLDEVKTIRVTDQERERTRLAPGDLLVVEGHGNPNEIGRVAQWRGEVDDCVHQNHLIRVRCSPRIKPRYLESYLNSLSGRQALLRAANTTSGLNTISTSDVRGVRIPLPGLAAQERFVLASERVDEERRRMLANQAGTERLFASLQQRAFRGDL